MTTTPGLDRLRPVYEAIHPRLWRAILGWSGSAEVADEAVAEAFAQAARRGEALDDPAAWVWRAAFRIAAGELARIRREPTEPLGDREVAQRSGLAIPAEAVDLLRALQQLGDQQRRAVVLTDGAGFPAPEAAVLMGTTAATVRVQASRARRRLRTLLSDADPSLEVDR
ncbi:MAG TPA: sigma factor-like helix-turn-helix DNA-binding protein [Iamia sp.]